MFGNTDLPLALIMEEILGWEKKPQEKEKKKRKNGERKITGARKLHFRRPCLLFETSKLLSFVKVVAQCPVELLLDGLTPFPVSFQHRNKLFLGTLVVLEGAGSFIALGVYHVAYLYLPGSISNLFPWGSP